jgi:hypothetical protein
MVAIADGQPAACGLSYGRRQGLQRERGRTGRILRLTNASSRESEKGYLHRPLESTKPTAIQVKQIAWSRRTDIATHCG